MGASTIGNRVLRDHIFKGSDKPESRRVIRKYNNRKYYDSVQHKYLSSADVFKLYGECIEARVEMQVLYDKPIFIYKDGNKKNKEKDNIEYVLVPDPTDPTGKKTKRQTVEVDLTFLTVVEGFKNAIAKDPDLAYKTVRRFYESQRVVKPKKHNGHVEDTVQVREPDNSSVEATR